jgi:hypothetical protein
MQVEKYTTNKGKDGIIVDGYKYRLDKAFKNTNLWRCAQTRCGERCMTDLTDLMVLDGRTDHNHEIEVDRKAQRSKLRQACKRKAVDDITERPQKLIIAECGKTENDTLVPEDISTIRQAVYRVRRRTQQKLPKSREETHVNLKDYEFNSTSGERMMHVNDPETGIIMFTTEGNNEYICQPDVKIFGDGPSIVLDIFISCIPCLDTKTGVMFHVCSFCFLQNQVNVIPTCFDILLRMQGTLDITFC